MKTFYGLAFVLLLALGAVASAQVQQTMLKAFAPPNSDGTSVILEIDWPQVKAAAPEVTQAKVYRRAVGPPKALDSVAVLPVDSARYEDAGLDPQTRYHYFAYFKDADGNTLKFGSYRAVAHLGPIATLPAKEQ